MNKKVLGILLGTAALLLVSCQDFLKGQETAEQIQSAITYANADYTLIKIQPQKGTGTVVKPAGGEAQQKPSDIFDLSFEPSADYEFVTWKVTSKKISDAADLQNYIKINDPDKVETTVTFKKPLDDIIITPVVVRRPKILSYSPIYTGSFSLKDTKIQVIFDRKMDPSCIYYSLDEINELKAELGLSDQDFLPENAVPGMTDIYGYKKNGEYIYKNISIKNNESQENINNRFNAPYFENPTTLIIPANRDLLPENYSFISVSIDKSFCYEAEYENISKKIGLFESKDWVYRVNNQDDNTPPTLSELEIQKKDESNQKVDLQILPFNQTYDPEEWAQKITRLKEKKIYIKIKAADEGSGVAPYFDIVLNSFLDKNYNSQQKITTLKTYFTKNDKESSYEGEIDLTDYSEGVYTLSILLYDNTGNSQKCITTKLQGQNTTVDASAYFIIDENIYINEPFIEEDENSDTKIKISWVPCWDLKSVDIKYSKNGGQDWTRIDQIKDIFERNQKVDENHNPIYDDAGNPIFELTITTNQLIEYSDFDKVHTFEISFKDWYGNSRTFTKTYRTKELCNPTISSISYNSVDHQIAILYSYNRKPSNMEKVYFVCSKDPNFSTNSNNVKKILLEPDEIFENLLYRKYIYQNDVKDYTYFKIYVCQKNDETVYKTSLCFKKITGTGTINFILN